VERGYTLLAPDLRGHGLSDKPDGDYGFDTFSADLGTFLGAFDLGRPVLVGHSWGATLALDMAARHPVGPRAPRGLVLVDGGVIQLDASGQDWEQTRARLTPPRLAGTSLDDFLRRMNASNPHWQPDETDIQIILANFEITEDEKIAPRLSFEHHMQIVRAMWEFQTFQRMQQVRCPVLAAPARPAEPSTEAEAEFLAFKERGLQRARQVLPGLKLHWMADSIHDIPLQRPAALAAVIAEFTDYLDVHPAPRRR
jgi:pimeloyl-ACP methyl ester carboxylesterase